MKKIILIWLGAIALIFVIGITWGAIDKQKNPQVTEIPQVEMIVGYDDEGNPIIQQVDQNKTYIEIEGTNYLCNFAAYNKQDFKIEGKPISRNFSIDDLLSQGFEMPTNTRFSLNNSTVIVNYNPSSNKALSLTAYTQSYLDITNYDYPTCENLELPSGIVLGKSKFEDVERVYGNTKMYPENKQNCKSLKYYMTPERDKGFMILYFDTEDVLCGIYLGCDLNP